MRRALRRQRPQEPPTETYWWCSIVAKVCWMIAVVLALSTVGGISSPLSHAADPEWVFPSAGAAPRADSDTAAVELGLKFTPKTSGTISAIRFYKPRQSSGPYTARLWDDQGREVAAASFPGGTAEGWQTAVLSPSAPVSAGRQYTASYSAPRGWYAAAGGYFPAPTETAHLRLPRAAGVYVYAIGEHPTQSFNNSNYYVDVQFNPVTSTTPTPTASSSPQGSEWVFPSAEAAPRPVADTAAVELGLRFTPKTSGTVSAIRFYKPRQSSGPYTARLWDDGGHEVAKVRFPAETAEGWQTVDFSPHVPVSAGRHYTASYSAPRGQYAAAGGYFTTSTDTAYLRMPPAAGVYRYAIGEHPTQSYNNSNYYVDVKFKPTSSASLTPTPTIRPTASASPTPSPTSTPTKETPPNAQPGTIKLPSEPWHGGPSYYAKFPKAVAAGWASPDFFPISVFFGKPSHAAALKSVGINTYMAAEHDGSAMSTITREGISVLASDEWTPAEVGNDPRVVGWHISDECEMGYSGCTPDWNRNNGEYGRLDVQRRYAEERRSLHDGRFLHANFGNGVLGTHWAPNTMDDHIALIDQSSVDKYAYTSPHVQWLFTQSRYWPSGKNPASAGAYGWQQDRMETFANPVASKPNWVFVETAMPYLTEGDATSITGDEIEGAVWNSIIHGASGIAYFQHNNNGCGNYSLVECSQGLRSKVTKVNAEVKSLAPVLNTPSYVWKFGSGLDTSFKAHAGSAYIFAMTDGGKGARTFTLPPDIKGGQVEVVGEGRTINLSSGKFSDVFAADHDHHIYRIAIE